MLNGGEMMKSKVLNFDNKVVAGVEMSSEQNGSNVPHPNGSDVPPPQAVDNSYRSKHMQFSGPNILSYDLCK